MKKNEQFNGSPSSTNVYNLTDCNYAEGSLLCSSTCDVTPRLGRREVL